MIEREICVDGNLVNLSQIARFVSDQALKLGISEDVAYDIEIAVDEACTNVVEHAYGDGASGVVRVCCTASDAEFIVRVTDYGKAFDPSRVPAPDLALPLEDRDIGGLGLYFMNTLMDSVEYASADGANHLTLRKIWRGNGS